MNKFWCSLFGHKFNFIWAKDKEEKIVLLSCCERCGKNQADNRFHVV